MIHVRRSEERGRTLAGWLDSRHTFSFADYTDPRFMGFRALRVLNEDWIQPGKGFGTHPHRDMEILTWVLEGSLEHRDSMGNGSVIRPGELQRMTAGTGVTHSEYNHSPSEPVHLLQIWMLPRSRDLPPGYEQKAFPPEELWGGLRLVASPDAREGSVLVQQDAELRVGRLPAGAQLHHRLLPGRHAWAQVARGRVALGEAEMSAGDGAAATDEELLALRALEETEILLFDLA